MNEGSVSARISATATKYSNKTALSFSRDGLVETDLSYAELEQDTNRMANTLLQWGIRKGDRVAFCLEKCLFFVVAHLASLKIGAISVPLNPGFKKEELTYLLGDAEPKVVFAGEAQGATLRGIDRRLHVSVVETRRSYQNTDFLRSASNDAPEIGLDPDDPGLIIYTSGTTGKPKGAVLSQQNLVHDATNIVRIWEITSSDVLCHALPLFHIHGLCFALHTSLLAGAHVLMMDAFAPPLVIDLLAKKAGDYACTLFMAVPSMYVKMLAYLGERVLDFSHIRLWASGSAPLLVKDFERLKKVFGTEPVEREGMSETGMNFSNPLRGKKKPGSIGLPLPGLEVRVVNPKTLKDVGRGQAGEIWLKGPGITRGYWQKPEETSKAFAEGWFRTGDLGRVDDEGYYLLTDRLKHIIISGGENISPKEIESVINRFEGIVESAVVGIPDEQWGEKVVAAAVPKPGFAPEVKDLRQFCKAHLHDWKCPKQIVLVKELPRNTMGKVLKEEIKNLFQRPKSIES
jgi:malonyl-CoA/methylmalonyl-CoA synthetase